jgi:hypothetical protein
MARNTRRTNTETVKRNDEERCDTEERFWQAVDQIRERNADKDPDEELSLITDVVEEVHQEQYDANRRKAEGCR